MTRVLVLTILGNIDCFHIIYSNKIELLNMSKSQSFSVQKVTSEEIK